MGCCGGSVPVRPGGICRATTGTGKRSTTGIAAGQRRGPGPRFSRSRAVVVIRTPRLASRCSGRRGSKDKESSANADRQARGRSRGGLTTTVHVAADPRCPPISRVIAQPIHPHPRRLRPPCPGRFRGARRLFTDSGGPTGHGRDGRRGMGQPLTCGYAPGDEGTYPGRPPPGGDGGRQKVSAQGGRADTFPASTKPDD